MLIEKGWMLPAIQFGPDDVFILEDWDETPAGPYRAIFHFNPDDYRTLYATTSGGSEIVSGIHRFEDENTLDIDMRRGDGEWTVEVDTGDRGILKMEIEYRETPLLKVVNPVACYMPDIVARSSLYCRMVPRLAGPIVGINPKQKMAGVTELERYSRFQISRIFKVTKGRCTWGDKDLGSMRDCCFEHDLGDFSLTPPMKPIVSQLTLFVD